VTDAELDSRLHQLESRWRADRSSRLFLQLAEELRRAGRNEEATKVLEEGLESHPDTISALVALGRCRLDAADPRRAAEALGRAVELDPSQWVANKLLVDAWIRLREPQRATERLAIYRLINDRDPESDELARRIAALQAESEGHAQPFALDRPGVLPLELPAGARATSRASSPFEALATPAAAARILDYFSRQGVFPAAPARLSTAPRADGARSPAAPAAAAAAALVPATSEEAPPRFSMRYIGEEVERESVEEPSAQASPPTPAPTGSGLSRETDEDAILEPHGSATLAALYLRQGHLDEAEQQYRTVLHAKPGDVAALAGLEEILRRRQTAAAAVPAGLTQRKLGVLEQFLGRIRRAAGRERHVS
jgi:tetratricopeptide (TPR) repeat protein